MTKRRIYPRDLQVGDQVEVAWSAGPRRQRRTFHTVAKIAPGRHYRLTLLTEDNASVLRVLPFTANAKVNVR